MALLDGLLGGNGNSILDDLLGSSSSDRSDSASHFETQLAANPTLDLNASDVLKVGEDGLTGVGDLGLGLGVPIFASITSSDASSTEGAQDGGLLSGLL